MIGYTLKHVLSLIPEALPLIKQASLEKEYPTASRDDCIASALAIQYKHLVEKRGVDSDVTEKVATAVTVYNLEDTIRPLVESMQARNRGNLVKSASLASEDKFLTKRANWEGDFSWSKDVQELSSRAKDLMEKAAQEGVDPGDRVSIYAGEGFVSKQAAIDALTARYQASKNDVFVKIASAVGREPDVITSGNTVKALCSSITRLDKEAGLDRLGFDFYRDAVITKSAGFSQCNVSVAGSNYPLERILGMPSSYLDDCVGPGFSKEVHSDPNSAKYVIESLPADSQRYLASVLKSQ